MSDLSDEDAYYNPESTVFDNDTKFDADDLKKEASMSNDNIPEKSIEFYSTTYMSKKEPDIMEDEEEEDVDDVNEDDEEAELADDDEDEDVDEVNDDSDDEDDDDESDNNENYYNDDNSTIDQLTDSQSLSNDYQDLFSEQPKKLNMTRNDETKMIHMRSFLNKVDKNFLDKDNTTQNIRKEILECKQNIEMLEYKRDDIFNKLKTAQASGNTTIVNRLDAEHATVCKEIEMETNVLNKLNEKFNDADYQRSKALLEKTKYNYANAELKRTEIDVARHKNIKAKIRVMQEESKVQVLKEKIKQNKQLESERVKEESEKLKQTIENAKLARKVTNQYFKQALREMKMKRNEEESHYLIQMEEKRKNLLNLKHTIDHNKEVFQAKVNQKKFDEAKSKQALLDKKNEILQRGENPNFFIPRQLKMEQVEKAKQKFKEEQAKNTQEIVKKILRENENHEKKKRLYPNLFNINPQPLTKRNIEEKTLQKEMHNLQFLGKVANTLGYTDENIDELLKAEEEPYDEEENYEQRSIIGDNTTIASKDDQDDESDMDELNMNEEILNKPEFDGLWNKKVKTYDSEDLYKESQKYPAAFKSKAEKELYLKTLDKLKKSAVREQIVAGRKFTGVSFKSQPRIVHFKDFDVGNKYTIKVTLTNISYTINTCKFIDLTEKLKDFISIDFQPPGQLSAGLTCEFNVTFEPKINKDLEGELEFLSGNGPFSIPIKCTIKKCDLSVNTNSVNFGTIVIGENLNRKIQLINKGALGTNFRISPYNKSDIAKQNTEEGIQLGDVKEGYIAPFSTIDIEYLFCTSFPGKFHEEFGIEFDDKDSELIKIACKAVAIDVPIWIENINIDLMICMYDRLYQEVIRVHNRASAALRITFEVPNEMKNHLEILPKTAFIQAKSDFSAQIKFVAKTSLEKDAPNFFDPDTGVLELPLFIRVADQNNVVNYNLHAIVTTSDLEFDVKEIDFGYCTIYETARATVNLTNKSILCQPFGFVKLSDCVNVQPNDGFGTLLPNETIPIDINFCPNSAKEYKFTVICKSLVNREFVINCKGIGVHPPLKLSAQRVNFKATCLNSSSFRTIYVCNEHLDYDQHRHPVPRIGKGEIAKVGPTSFEFDIPPNCPFELSPAVGTVAPGQRVKITLQYRAKLDESMVKAQALKILKEKQAIEAAMHHVDAVEQDTKFKKKGLVSSLTKMPESLSSDSSNELKSIEVGSKEYNECLNLCTLNYKGGLEHFQVSCYVSTVSENPDPSKPVEYNINNTLYLDVVCPSVKPEMILVNGSTNIDFGSISIGHKCIKKIGIKNISNETIDIKNSLLDTDGPFSLMNAMKPIEPGGIHNLIICFTPNKSFIYREVFEVKTVKKHSNLNFVLSGVGVDPNFSLSFDAPLLDFGYCLAGERLEKNIEMKNNSNVPIQFTVTLDSSNKTYRKECEQKRFSNISDPTFRPPIGPSNFNGLSSFDVFPIQGTIQAGSKLDLKVFFSPDHASELYADVMRIQVMKNSRVIQLAGKSRKSNIYIKGVEMLTSNLNNESLILTEVDAVTNTNADQANVDPQAKPNEGDMSAIPTAIPILVTLYSISSSKAIGEYSTAEKTITIGCTKSNKLVVTTDKKDAGKKSGEFSFENVKDINVKGFNIDLQKSAIEFGGERQVKITWKPPPGVDAKQTTQATVVLATKANSTELWKVVLQGRIVSESFKITS